MADPYGSYDYCWYIAEELHKHVLTQLDFKSVIKSRDTLWPGIDKETYVNRLMTTYLGNHNLFLPTEQEMKADTSGARIDRKGAPAVSVGLGSTQALRRSVVTDVMRSWKLQNLSIDKIAPYVASGKELRPMMCFVTNVAYMFPSYYLSVVLNCWINAVMDLGAQDVSTLDQLKIVLGVDRNTNSPLEATLWVKVVNGLIEKYCTDAEAYASACSDIPAEWIKVRHLTKLLVVMMGPQASR